MSLPFQVTANGLELTAPAGKDIILTVSGAGRVEFAGGIKKQVVGKTADILYGGDMSSDTAGMGIKVVSADGDNHFAHAVYADDGGAELAAGWVSAIFGSMKTYIAVTPSCNLSAFGVTGQIHAAASIASIGNIAGVYGIAETVTGVTLDANFFGGTFGAVVPSGATLGAGQYTGGIIIGGSYAGTISGKAVGVFLQNPGSTKQFDAAFAFGQDSQMAGCVTVAAVGGSQTHKLKVYAGGTLFYIPLHTA